ncbi:unnamed protein product, partial [Rotaria magnacalcarata]
QLIVPSETKQKLSYSTTLPIWPKEIKTIILSSKKDKTNENEICLKFTNGQLNALQHQLKQYRQEFDIKPNNFQGYRLSIQKMLMTYVEKNLNSSLHKKIEHQVELIYYDYHIRALKLEYIRHKPTENQTGFEYFQIRFANSSDQKEPTSAQDRSRRALSNALLIFFPKTYPSQRKTQNTAKSTIKKPGFSEERVAIRQFIRPISQNFILDSS